MSIAKEDVEILVHTTAPALGRDDARYRALASAYLDFQPARRRKVELSLVEPSISHLDTQLEVDETDYGLMDWTEEEERESGASWRPEEAPESMSQGLVLDEVARQDFLTIQDSPDLSFDDVEDNRFSPQFRGLVARRQTTPQRSVIESVVGQGDEIPDSQPDLHPSLAVYSSPTRVLEVFLQNQNISQSTSSSPSSASRDGKKATSSLEVPNSNGNPPSSPPPSLPRLRRISEVSGTDDRPPTSYSVSNGRSIVIEETSLEVLVTQQSSVNKEQKGSSLEIRDSNESSSTPSVIPATSSSQQAQTNSSPSPAKRVQRALQNKSPNRRLSQELQLKITRPTQLSPIPKSTMPPSINKDTIKDGKRKYLSPIVEVAKSSSAPLSVIKETPLPPRPTKKARLEPNSSPTRATRALSPLKRSRMDPASSPTLPTGSLSKGKSPRLEPNSSPTLPTRSTSPRKRMPSSPLAQDMSQSKKSRMEESSSPTLPTRYSSPSKDNSVEARSSSPTLPISRMSPRSAHRLARKDNPTNSNPSSSAQASSSARQHEDLSPIPLGTYMSSSPAKKPPSSPPAAAGSSSPAKSILYSPSSSFIDPKWATSLEIMPPTPATSHAHLQPSDFITPKMHSLASTFAPTTYTPAFLLRPLRPMERGHWLVDTSAWSQDRRDRCWNFLGRMIAGGSLGWGVWAVRTEGWEEVRVFCWGVVVEFVYLVVLLASEMKILGMGIVWRGGDNTVIVRMPKKEKEEGTKARGLESGNDDGKAGMIDETRLGGEDCLDG